MGDCDKVVGLVGLGLMGRALGERLIAHGHRVLGHDVAPSATAGFRGAGGTMAPDASAVFVYCDRILLSPPTDRKVHAVLHQAADSLRTGQVILDITMCTHKDL